MQVVSSRLIFFLFFYISDILISQNIQLNEIVSSNATIIKDEDGEISEVELSLLYNEIESEFGKAPDEPDAIEEAARKASHKMDARITKLESGLDKLRDRNVASMQRFIADARNQAFRDELSLDLEDGYQEGTFVMFDEVRKQIQEEEICYIMMILMLYIGFHAK